MKKAYPLKRVLVQLFQCFAAMLVFCLIFSVTAGFGFYTYGREVVRSFGADDRSLLFWYLPLLFIGIISAQIAAATGYSAYKKFKELRRDIS